MLWSTIYLDQWPLENSFIYLFIYFPEALATFRSHCFTPLGLESGVIFDSQITASSFVGSQFKSQNARLHSTNCWSPSDANPWIEIKLYQFARITRIATQGRRDADEWVTQYYIRYGTTWWSALVDYTDGGGNVEVRLQFSIS